MSDTRSQSPTHVNTAPTDLEAKFDVDDLSQIDGAGDASSMPPEEGSTINTTADGLPPSSEVKVDVCQHGEPSLYLRFCSIAVCFALVAVGIGSLYSICRLINAHPALSVLAAMLAQVLSVLAVGSWAPGEVCCRFACVVGIAARIITNGYIAGYNAVYNASSIESGLGGIFEQVLPEVQKDIGRAADSLEEIAKCLQANTTTQGRHNLPYEIPVQQRTPSKGPARRDPSRSHPYADHYSPSNR